MTEDSSIQVVRKAYEASIDKAIAAVWDGWLGLRSNNGVNMALASMRIRRWTSLWTARSRCWAQEP